MQYLHVKALKIPEAFRSLNFTLNLNVHLNRSLMAFYLQLSLRIYGSRRRRKKFVIVSLIACGMGCFISSKASTRRTRRNGFVFLFVLTFWS